MYHDFESHTITRRSFLKGAGAVGAAGLLAACGGSSSSTAASASSASSGAAPIMDIRIFCSSDFNSSDEIFFPVCTQSSDRELGAGEDHRLTQILKHKT